MAIDAKDQITHGHIRRVQMYAVRLAQAVGVTDQGQIRAIEAAALLHDMGKLAVPEYILNKPGALTPAEFEKMKLHASVGADILSAIEFPYPVVPIVRHHHESWDGSGYPDGISGPDIPIGARVLSVVDCFDALTSDRPYRPRLSDADALKILVDRRGSMYDPLIVDTFIRVCAEITPETRSAATIPQSFTAITEAATPPPHLTGVKSLEDITASSEEMLSLFDLSKGLSGQMGLSDAADVILKHLKRMVPFSLAVFYLYDEETDELVAGHASGQHSGLINGLRIPLGQRLTGWVAAHRQSIRNSDPVLDLGEIARSIDPRPRSALSTPLLLGDKLVGVLSLYSTSREAFTEDHLRVMEAVAPRVAPVVQHSVGFDRAKLAAYRDQVTGLPNIEQLRRFARDQNIEGATNIQLSVIHIDVLGLKTVNAAHGREIGDRVLIHVARCAQKHLRSTDVLFQYASDEFVVVLLQTGAGTAEAIASTIKDAVESPAGELMGVRCSVAVSVAESSSDGSTLEALVAAARSRLKLTPPTREIASHKPPPESVH
jgi:diguanylate cyclase (GGDEF)-like protein/putative nucleotidyltransferase with HDIG domain